MILIMILLYNDNEMINIINNKKILIILKWNSNNDI